MILESICDVELRKNFKSDRSLVSKILDLTRPSYVNNEVLIDREIEHNSDIYIINNDKGDLLAFFMINFEPLRGSETYYLGLSACRDEYKGKGLGKSLYMKFMQDCREREKKENKRFLLWWTTGTPIVYYWFNKYVTDVQPDMNGNFDETGKDIALAIIAEKFKDIHVDRSHPFILRSVAEHTQYSSAEHARIQAAGEKLGMDVFSRFNVREENADRFLMIGYAPD
jgi:hypothetical protein